MSLNRNFGCPGADHQCTRYSLANVLFAGCVCVCFQPPRGPERNTFYKLLGPCRSAGARSRRRPAHRGKHRRPRPAPRISRRYVSAQGWSSGDFSVGVPTHMWTKTYPIILYCYKYYYIMKGVDLANGQIVRKKLTNDWYLY